jgi:hypothetical protein
MDELLQLLCSKAHAAGYTVEIGVYDQDGINSRRFFCKVKPIGSQGLEMAYCGTSEFLREAVFYCANAFLSHQKV